MATPQQSIPADVVSVSQEEKNGRETKAVEGTMTFSQSRVQKRSLSPFIMEGSKKSAGVKRPVIKPVINEVTRLTDNMIVLEETKKAHGLSWRFSSSSPTSDEESPDASPGPQTDSSPSVSGLSRQAHSSSRTSENESPDASPGPQPVGIVGGNFSNTHIGPRTSNNKFIRKDITHHDHSSAGKNLLQGQRTEEDEPRIVPARPANVPTQGGKKLTDSVTAYPDAPLARWCRVYPGVQKMGFGIERPVAVKIVPYSEKKIREAKNLLKLTPHVNVVSIIDADELKTNFNRTIYIVMEQCQTMNLEQYYKNRKQEKIPFNTKQALEFARQVMDGINHIHAKGILHRDMKPSSILFTLDGKFLKIIDFGVSKELKNGLSTISMTSRRIGTDGYRAPETYRRDQINKFADIFSLAIVLYYIWSDGRHPFGDDITAWTYNICNYKNLSLELLLVPDKEKAKDLLSEMLREESHERLNISNVLMHEYICEGVQKTLTKEMAEAWRGLLQVKDQDEQSKQICCIIYEREGESSLKTEGRLEKLSIKYFPDAGIMKKLSEGVEGIPDGYLAIQKAEHYSLLNSLKNNKMGWIDIMRQGGSRNAMLIFHPKGYEELYGVYVENPEGLVSTLHDEYGGEHASTEETSSLTTVTETPQQPIRADKSLQDAMRVEDAVTIPELASESDVSLPTDTDLLGYISWWVYKPEEPQQPATSSQQ